MDGDKNKSRSQDFVVPPHVCKWLYRRSLGGRCGDLGSPPASATPNLR